MSGDEAWSAAEAATIQVSSRDLAAGTATTEAQVALHACSSCGAQFADRYHFDCPECGHEGVPLSRCRSCQGQLQAERVRYVAHAPEGGSVAKILPGATCPSCDVSGVEHHQLAKLDALAARLGEHLEFLPEAGIYTAAALEVLADAEISSPGAPDEIEKHLNGMSVRIGGPSALFEAAFELVTDEDPGNVFSPTLQVTPGPPYSAAQRRTFHLLLGEIQRDLGAPVICWSASFALSEDPPVDALLTEQLMTWQGDQDGQVLALYHDLVADRAPGRLLNSVRFLELVLSRRQVAALIAARRDSGVTDQEFLELVEGLSLDLGSRLRRTLSSFESPPLGILQRLWVAMRPGKSFDEHAVCDAIARFPERYLARRDGEAVRLPWEEPDFDGYARELQKLVSAILDQPSH